MKTIATAGAILLSLGCCVSQAQNYPTRPIRMIVPFAAGGPTDVLARLIAQKLTENLRQQVIVDNRGGAASTIGSEAVAHAAPDGYTILIGHIGVFAINPTLYPKLSYNVLRDFAPVSLVADIPYGLVVHPALPARNVPELIRLARSKPGEMLYGSGGSGSASHLAGIYFGLLAKVNFTFVAYRGSGPALIDLRAGQTSMMITGLLPLVPHISAGRIRILAVGSDKRLPIMPKVPTIGETVKGYKVTQWYGIAVPVQTSRNIVATLNAAIVKSMSGSDVRERLAAGGADPLTSTPEEFSQFIKNEITRWAPVVKAAGIESP